jgi:hypothetical protein
VNVPQTASRCISIGKKWHGMAPKLRERINYFDVFGGTIWHDKISINVAMKVLGITWHADGKVWHAVAPERASNGKKRHGMAQKPQEQNMHVLETARGRKAHEHHILGMQCQWTRNVMARKRQWTQSSF